MSKGKTPLHLRLTHTDWVECFTELNKAELGVLFYIRTLDPYGDRELDVRSEVVAEVLGLHRSSVSRALKTLANKNLINLEITSAKVTSKARSLKTTALCADAQSERTDAQSERTDARSERTDARSERTDARSERTDARSVTPKALPDKAPDSPQTIQTYSDFTDSLSDSEREDFFEFVEKATKNLTKPINDLEAWLASKTMAGQNRWEVYYNNFQEFKLLKKAERAKKSVENNALAKWQAQIEEQRKRAEKAWESQKKDV